MKNSKNKYLISTDIEGITGVANRTFSDPGGKFYEQARRYMANDVNAVIEGIISVDPDAYILVRDAHSAATNLNIENIHPDANLYQGWGDSINMLEGLDNSYKGVFLVGYHAGATNNEAVLAHTFTSKIKYVKLNNKIINETGIAALYASYFKVPIALVSGDNNAVNEAKFQLANLGPITFVAVKESCARNAAISVSLGKAKKLLKEGAARATQDLQSHSIMVFTATTPLQIEIAFHNIGYQTSIYQKLRKTLEFDNKYIFDNEYCSVKYQSNDVLESLAIFNLIIQLTFGLRDQ